MSPVLLEVCVDSRAGLEAAISGGADRIELCSRLDVGGLSPTPDLVDAALRTTEVPLHVMVRPRPGDFVYAAEDLDTMRRETAAARARGLAGIVLGVLGRDGRVDRGALAGLVAAARPLSVTFHRAFDEVADAGEALEDLVAAGVDRVLSSGGAPDAHAGRNRLADLVRRARGRIVVMAGGGVRAGNARAILDATGVAELHGSVPFRLGERNGR